MSQVIQLRNDTAATWTSVNPTLAVGEIGLETDTKLYKIGDGTSTWSALSYAPFASTAATVGFTGQTADPSVPAAGTLTLYSKAIAGRMMVKQAGPSGLTTALQPFLARNKVGYWCPPGNATTQPGVFGYTAPTYVGSAVARSISIANTFQRMRRLGYYSSTTAGSVVSARVSYGQVTVGDGAGNGGFHKIIRFGCSDNATVAGARQFIGMAYSTSAPTNVEPSSLTNVIGIGNGTADTTMHMYCAGSSTTTPIDLGASFPANTLSADPYELALFSPSSANADVYWEVTNIGTGAVATGLFNGTPGTQVPSSSTLLSYLWCYRTNNTTPLSVALDFMSDYIETDN